MTYQEALKKRARLAYTGLQKKAEGDEAQNKAWNKKVDEEEAGRQHYIAEKNGIVNRAQGEQYSRDLAAEKQRKAEAQAYNDAIRAAGEKNLESGKEVSNFISSAKTLGANGGMDLNTAERILLMNGTGSLPDDLQRLVPLAQQLVAAKYTGQMGGIVNRAQGEDKVRQIEQQKADAAFYDEQNNNMLAKLLRDQGAATAQGNAMVPGIKRQQYMDSLNARRQEIEQLANKNPQLLYPLLNQLVARGASADDILAQLTQADIAKDMEFDSAHRKEVAAQKALENRNLGIGIGAGALGGLGAAGAAYGLAGLFPSLRKKRLLRALIALGVGGAAGAGIGIGTTKGLNSGAIQGAYGATKDYLGSVGRGLSGKA